MFQTKTISYRLITCLLTVILLLPFTASASFMGTATFSSVPPGARLEPVQILIDDNLTGGAGIANVVDYNTSSPLGYFIVGHGEVNGTFPWMRNFSTENQVFAQKMVRFKDSYFILYTEYVQFATPNGAFLLQLDAGSGAIMSNTRLVFDGGATEISGVDIVVSEPYEMLYVVCNGKNNGYEVNLLGAYDINNNTMLDARMVEFGGSSIHADALAKETSAIGTNEHLHIGGRVMHTNFYEEVYVQKYFFDYNIKQFVAATHNVFKWNSSNRLFMSRLKFHETTGHLVLAAQTWAGPDGAGNLELWHVDVGGTSLVQAKHYAFPGSMFISDINLNKEIISLAGPNNMFDAGIGNVIALFDYNLNFWGMNQYQFNGTMLEPTAMSGPIFNFPFVMAVQDAFVPEYAKWTVGYDYFNGQCEVKKRMLRETDYPIGDYQALTETQVAHYIKEPELKIGREELKYEIECGKPGKKEATGIEQTVSVADYKFYQDHTMAQITTQGKIKSVVMYDINGRKIADYKADGSSVRISKYGMVPGIYMLSFEINGMAKREKLVVN